MIKIEKTDFNEVQKFCKNIYNSLTYKVELDDWVLTNLGGFRLEYFSRGESNFLKLLSSDFEILSSIKDYIDKNSIAINFDDDLPTGKSGTTTLKKYLINRYDDKIDKKAFVKLTGVTVCPYCNRNFVNVTKLANNSQLDHFYPKSSNGNNESYPIFALCFYNLIPSCHGCNHKKSYEKFNISPYDRSIDREKLLTFSWRPVPLKSSPLYDKSAIEITTSFSNEAFENDFNILDLKEQYQLHTDVVQEILWKKTVYDKTYQDGLKSLSGIGLTKGDFERVITGVYTNSDSYGKRPLSKLIADISREIGLIEEK